MRKIVLGLVALLVVLLIAGCGNQSQRRITKVQQVVVSQDVLDIENQLEVLRKAEPLPTFLDSAALRVQGAYYTADSDPNKLWYVSIVSPYSGAVIESFTTRGAPQPSGDQVTNPAQLYCQRGARHAPGGCGTIGLPEPNGVHQGTGNDGYVAILTTGAMKRFSCNGVYCDISDQPLSVKRQPILTIDESAAISHTDESKTSGAVIPHGTGKRK